MGTTLKTAVQKAKVNDFVDQIAAITTYDAVAKELNENGTVKKSLKDDLEAFAAALAEKASSTAVTGEIQQACKDLYNKILGKANDDVTINEAYDTLVEIANWIGSHGEAAATIVNDVTKLKTDVEALVQQIAASGKTTVKASETNGNITVDGQEIEVYQNPGQNIFVASTAAQATAAEGKMKEGDILFQIVPGDVELKDAPETVQTANHFIGNLATLISNGTLTEEGHSTNITVDGKPAVSNIPAYKYGKMFSGNVDINDILYLDNYDVGGVGLGTVNLSTGAIGGGSSFVSFPSLKLPTGYYKIKNVAGANNTFNIIGATFDSSGNVTDITKSEFNANNDCVEYLGESYLVTEQ